MIGAIILGLLAGFIAKALMPGDDPGGFFVTILLGLAGSLVGFFIFTELLGIGDDQAFDLGGLVGAIIGTIIAALAYGALASVIERALATRREQEPQEPAIGGNELAMLRRGVLTFDILIFAGLGYWIGDKLVG
jgi:uncharacterized membrane protein YeaQ/YmgE (transglycosylase-associated protein family)